MTEPDGTTSPAPLTPDAPSASPHLVKRLARRVYAAPLITEVMGVLERPGMGRTMALRAVASLAISAVGLVLSFVVQVVLANAIGLASYGIYVYVMAWLNVALIAGRLDLDIVLTRFAGAYVAREQWSLLRGLVSRTRKIAFTMSASLAVVALLVLLVLRARLEPELYHSARLATALLPLTAILLLTGGALQGLNDVAGSLVPYTVLRPLLFLVALALAGGIATRPLHAVDAIALSLAVIVVVLPLALFRLHTRLPPPTRSSVAQYETRPWLQAAGWFVLIDLFQLTISQQSDVLIVGSMLGKTAVAQYGAASQFAMMVHFAVTAVIFIITPAIAELFAQQRTETLRRLIRNVIGVNLLLSAPVLAIILLAGRPLLGLYGEGFVAGYPALVVLGFNQLVAAGIGTLAGTIMSMTGHQREAAWMVGVSAAMNLLLSFILTPRLGLIGAAAATLTATVLRSFLLARYLRRELQLLLPPTAA